MVANNTKDRRKKWKSQDLLQLHGRSVAGAAGRQVPLLQYDAYFLPPPSPWCTGRMKLNKFLGVLSDLWEQS